MRLPKVIYLTGAPASGKSTASRKLQDVVPDLVVFEYGARLTEMIAKRRPDVGSQDDLRSRSALVVTKEDVEELDRRLIEFVDENRQVRNVLIDLHPVTKEWYGFRITAFSDAMLRQVNPSEIWVLFASATATIDRIERALGGRPTPTSLQAEFHTQLQASVAATYGILSGAAVYFFDSEQPQSDYVTEMARRLDKT